MQIKFAPACFGLAALDQIRLCPAWHTCATHSSIGRTSLQLFADICLYTELLQAGLRQKSSIVSILIDSLHRQPPAQLRGRHDQLPKLCGAEDAHENRDHLAVSLLFFLKAEETMLLSRVETSSPFKYRSCCKDLACAVCIQPQRASSVRAASRTA
jgi:hypothetical protein